MRVRGSVAVTAVLLVAACGGSASAPEPSSSSRVTPNLSGAPTSVPAPAPEVRFPGRTWDRAAAGDWSAFDQSLASDGSTCVAVIKEGRLVHDAYFNGGGERSPRPVYSITKSLTSLLVGTFTGDGTLDLDASASEEIDEWRTTAAEAVSVRSLLGMVSGRAWDQAADRHMIRVAGDKTAYAVGRPQAEAPGSVWRYDNIAAQALESVLDDLAETSDVAALAEQRLLEPLGMRDTTWARDATGNALTFSGVQSTCLDLARVGYLVLNEGTWKGQQLVPADFIAQATSPSSQLNAAYGLMWWTNQEGRIVEVLRQAGFASDKAPYEGRLAPSVPADATWAFGYGNQYIAVVPSEGVVAVRLGARPATPDRVTFETFTAGVLKALE